MSRPKRPIMRFHGGKWTLAPWVIEQLPPHSIYVEPYAGAGSVLLRKPRSFAEVLNDLDGEVVNVFRVLRDPASAAELVRLLELTPWSREEFRDSYRPTEDPIERARRRLARAFMAFGTTSARENKTGFRAKAYRSNQTGPEDWRSYPAAVPLFVDRLRGVCIENRPALEVIAQQDGHDTLFYVDPPYPHSTRTAIDSPSKADRAYVHDMSDDQHRELAAALHQAAGMVAISGYPCPLYDEELYPTWERRERQHLADGARPRTEVLWLNPRAADGRRQGSLAL